MSKFKKMIITFCFIFTLSQKQTFLYLINNSAILTQHCSQLSRSFSVNII